MTRLFIITILTFILCSCSTREKRKVIKTFPTGQTQEEIVYNNPKDTLGYIKVTYFYNGQVKTSVDIYDGRFNGRIIEYYQNGKKKFEGLTQMGYFVDKKSNYYENGNLWRLDSLLEKCKADDCNCNSVLKTFYPSGKLEQIGIVKNGLLNGEGKVFYETGLIKEQHYYVDEQLNGVSKWWYANGKIKKEKTFRLGIPDGLTTEYYDNYKVQGYYVNGKEEGEWKTIDTLGTVTGITLYKNGVVRE